MIVVIVASVLIFSLFVALLSGGAVYFVTNNLGSWANNNMRFSSEKGLTIEDNAVKRVTLVMGLVCGGIALVMLTLVAIIYKAVVHKGQVAPVISKFRY